MVQEYAALFYKGASQGLLLGFVFFIASYGLTVGLRLLADRYHHSEVFTMKSLLTKKAVALLAVASVMASSASVVFADTETETAMTTALTGVKTDAISALGIVAPIAIGIMGAFLVWRFGVRFFKGLAK